jgi:hypothetical protein
MSNPTDGPFDKAAPLPQYGDPEILPKGRIVRPSRERLPFGPSGERIEPDLPSNFLLAPDIEGLAWTRKRGDEWTDADFRAIVMQWLIEYLGARTWPLRWDVTERATSIRMTQFRLPPEQQYLVLGITRQGDGERFETAMPFPPAKRDETGARELLDQMGAVLDAQEAA